MNGTYHSQHKRVHHMFAARVESNLPEMCYNQQRALHTVEYNLDHMFDSGYLVDRMLNLKKKKQQIIY